jgi:hypothetical protein
MIVLSILIFAVAIPYKLEFRCFLHLSLQGRNDEELRFPELVVVTVFQKSICKCGFMSIHVALHHKVFYIIGDDIS